MRRPSATRRGSWAALCAVRRPPLTSPPLRAPPTPAAGSSGAAIPSILDEANAKWFEDEANVKKWEAWFQDEKAVKEWEASLQ